jgi:purine-binding chemotaxis protein CheW
VADALRGHLVFSCGGGLFGLPAEWAAEVVNLPALTLVPGAPAHVLGVFSHRGELMPVIDLLVLTAGAGPSGAAPWKRAVVIRRGSTALALTATRVLGVTMLEGAPAPEGTSGISKHLQGPLSGRYGEVRGLELEGLIEFLSSRNPAAS